MTVIKVSKKAKDLFCGSVGEDERRNDPHARAKTGAKAPAQKKSRAPRPSF